MHQSVLKTISLAFADCAAGRTVSVAWACREKFKAVQDCIYQLYVLYHDNNWPSALTALASTRPESMQLVRDEYLRLRNEQQEQ